MDQPAQNLCQACCEPVTITRQLLVVHGPENTHHLRFLQSKPHFKPEGDAEGLHWITSEEFFGRLLSSPNVSFSFLTVFFNAMLLGNKVVYSAVSSVKPVQDIRQRFPETSLFACLLMFKVIFFFRGSFVILFPFSGPPNCMCLTSYFYYWTFMWYTKTFYKRLN